MQRCLTLTDEKGSMRVIAVSGEVLVVIRDYDKIIVLEKYHACFFTSFLKYPSSAVCLVYTH